MRRETFDDAGRDPLSSTLMHDSASLPQWARGSERSGSLMPPALFLIADACLNVGDHTPQLFSQLDSPLPVHLLGVERCNHLRTIQGMAAHLIEEIRLVQPCGSYRIAGRGMAGLLAYEIGLQLVGADQEVEFVGLIETCVPALPGRI